MAGQPGRSGGHNKVSVDDHLLRGTFRPYRHAGQSSPPPVAVSDADRKFALQGLPRVARKIASRLLEQYTDWNMANLDHLRNFALSCARLRTLQAGDPAPSPELSRELRNNERLYKLLNLER
jgi:hypothetical protein